MFGCNHRDAYHQRAGGGHQNGRPIVQAPYGDRPEAVVTKTVKAIVEALAQFAVGSMVVAAKGRAQVPGQNQEAFDQRRDNDADDDKRNIPQHLPHNAADQHQRQEGGDGRERRAHDRNEHASGAPFGRFERSLASLIMGHGVFRHDDGIVHDNAQCHDEGEQADHVDAAAVEPQNGHGAHQRNGDTGGDPERDAAVEEYKQDPDHQNQAADTVFKQQVYPVDDQFVLLIKGDQLNAFG